MSKALFCHAQVADAAGIIVSSSTATRTVDAASVCNPTASAATLSLWLVPNGGSAADVTKVLHAQSIDAGTSAVLPVLINQCIPPGFTLRAQASAASALTLTVSGRSQ